MRRTLGSSSGSEATEQQELDEITRLLSQAREKANDGDAINARKLTYEAYGIDKTHINTLVLLVKLNVVVEKFEEAQYHAESLMDLYPDNPLGVFLKGFTLLQMRHYRDCITSLLSCLSMGFHEPKEATNLIALAVQGILSLPAEFVSETEDLDYYAQLTEIGVKLLSSKLYLLTVQVLKCAAQFKSDDVISSMRLYLTIGHALCATRQFDSSLDFYQKCLDMATSCRNVAYQTKAYVNIAALQVSKGDTYQALVVYEQLIDLYSRLRSDRVACDDIWTDEFIYGLYMNASLAHKDVGNIDLSIHYAKKSLEKKKSHDVSQELIHVHKHLGSLYMTLAQYPLALAHFKGLISMAKCSGNKLRVAEAYGLLGSLYGSIGLWPVSSIHHERHISLALSLLNEANTSKEGLESDVITMRNAVMSGYDMYGDSLLRKKMFKEAVDNYLLALKYCSRNALGWCRIMYKIGDSHLKSKNNQHALHYLEQALKGCEDGFQQLKLDIQLGIAVSMQTSSSSGQLETSREYFMKCIESYRNQIEECISHQKFLPQNKINKLRQSFKGIQTVLAKLGRESECLELAEQAKLFQYRLLTSYKAPSRLATNFDLSKIVETVNSQNATIIYYSFLDDDLLMWLLSPGAGITRFYIRRSTSIKHTVEEELLQLMSTWSEIFRDRYSKSLYKFSSRHVEVKDASMAALKKSAQTKESNSEKNNTKENNSDMQKDGEDIYKQLYKLLVAPVDDLLSKAKLGSHLIIVPDGCVNTIPFSFLKEFKGHCLAQKFQITQVPSIYAIKMLMENEVTLMQDIDLISFRRQEARLGGFYKYFHSAEMNYSKDDDHSEVLSYKDVDRRKVANPRLAVAIHSEQATNCKTAGEADVSNAKMNSTDLISNGCFSQLSLELIKTPRHKQYGMFFELPKPALHGHSKMSDKFVHIEKSVLKPLKHARRVNRGHAADFHRLCRTENLTTLISNTSTGTDALNSSTAIPMFGQVCNLDKFVVIGSPRLSTNMEIRGLAVTVTEAYAERSMLAELENVADILGCDCVFGDDATKQEFMKQAVQATVLHITTMADLAAGYFLMSCDSSKLAGGNPIQEKYFLVTTEDIVTLKMTAKLVVISGGWTQKNWAVEHDALHRLPLAFIHAGCQSVLIFPYPETDHVFLDFLKVFYSSFQTGSTVCNALNCASQSVVTKHLLPCFYAVLYGNNMYVDNSEVRSAMLHQQINELETATSSYYQKDWLNEPSPPKVLSLVERLDVTQMYLSEILSDTNISVELLNGLHGLLSDGVVLTEKLDKTLPNLVVLPAAIVKCPPAVHLLSHLGYAFGPRGLTIQHIEPAVAFPCSDVYGILEKIKNAVGALIDILKDRPAVITCLCDMLPLAPSIICFFIDMLCITRHAPDVQLNVNDESVDSLWTRENYRDLLKTIGYHQVGTFIHFNSTYPNRQLTKVLLQFFLSMSTKRPSTLLDQFDSASVGTSSQNSGKELKEGSLPSILPVLLPNEQMVRRVPWVSRVESKQEMKEKVKVATSIWKTKRFYNQARSSLKQLHGSYTALLSSEILHQSSPDCSSREKGKAVKVLPGGTASLQRTPVSYVEPLTPDDMEQRRKYTDYLIRVQQKDLEAQEKQSCHDILSQYADVID